MEFLLYNHGSSYNHGCEAIIRTVSEIIEKRFPESNFTVSSIKPGEDREVIGENGTPFSFINSDFFNRFSFEKRRFIVGSMATLLHTIPMFNLFFSETVEAAKRVDAMISVGGDTFSYGKSAALTAISNKLRKYCATSVLWGCSIDAKYLEGDEYKYKTKGLKSFSLITARESITYETLKKLGFTNVELYPDPAFTLKAIPPSDELFDNDHDIVGINISPLILGYENERGRTSKCYAALIKRILDTTDFNIALISHVRCQTSDDTNASRGLINLVGENDRIKIFDRGNAMELKGIISKCRFFVAARTHASIAAYSTKVPTLVVGYSVKSMGIARDLFGTEEGYTIPVSSLSSDDSLFDAFFGNIVKNEDAIRAHYDRVMPEYIARADAAGDEFAKLLSRPKEVKW